MKRENLAYLIGGIVFGIVLGLILSYAIFYKRGPVTQPEESSPEAAVGEMQQPPEHVDIMKEIESLKGVVRNDPQNYDALVRLGNIYFDAAKFLQAIDYYEKAVAIKDTDPDVLTDLGICYRNNGDPKKAIGLFEKAHGRNPSHWQSVYNIFIVSLNDLGDIPAAEKALEMLEKLKPGMEGLDMMKKQLERVKEESGKQQDVTS